MVCCAGDRARALARRRKRYLTTTDPGYFATLSAGSVRSLELQGGPFSVEEAACFIGRPFAADAVRLRRWDEAAKVPGKTTPDLEHFRRHLNEVRQSGV